MNYRLSTTDKIGKVVIVLILIFLSMITLFPMIYVFSMSISDPIKVAAQEIYLLPKGFSIESYKMLFEDINLWKSYYNTIWYAVVGTTFSIVMTVTMAYPLSDKNFGCRNVVMMFVVVTMFFSGGMIPSFILVNSLGLYDTRWAIILPAAINTWNLIIARTFFQNIPIELKESAFLDGANDARIFWSIIIPLSKPIIAVLCLYYAVAFWNSYMPAILYLPSGDLQPLQIYLRKMLVIMSEEMAGEMEAGLDRATLSEQMKYSVIILTILPIICVYPFIQKYFVKGVMVGAIK